MNIHHVTTWILIALSLCLICNGQMIYRGKCPKPPLQPSFNIEKYMGTWYEIGRTYAFFELGKRCIYADYTLMEHGFMVGIVNHATNYWDHKTSVAGKGMVDPHRPGRLMVKIGKSPFWSNYNVLSTDYENYALVWSCSNLAWILHTEILWVLAREQTLTAKSWNEINHYIKQNNIRTLGFRMTKQIKCEFDFYS